jgi:predicted SAM-dependent methyltransferase
VPADLSSLRLQKLKRSQPLRPLRALVHARRRRRSRIEGERRRIEEERLAREAVEAIERRRAERLRAAQASKGLLLDIGTSAAHVRPGWVGLDIDPDEQTLRLDAAQPWPLPDACARAVRSEHMIEHLSWDEATFCISEMARVLEPGGVCRICTPDLEGIAAAYLARDPRVLALHRADGYLAPTWAHMPNNYLRRWGHAFVFDFEALQLLLDGAGFEQIERTGFNQSRHELLDGTDSHDPGELAPLVLCVDAVRRRA